MATENVHNLFAGEGALAPRVIAVAGPTGGVGATLFAANLGIHLAKKGRSVLLADLALTEAGCHLALGLSKTEKHLGTLLAKQVADLKDAVVPTPVANLSLLAGCPDLPEVANLAYLVKQKILGSLRTLPFDFVIVDAGAGTGADTLDFFLAGDLSVMALQATPAGVEPFYRFLRAALRRLLMESLNRKRYQALAPLLDPHSPLSGFWDLPETQQEDLSAVEAEIRKHRFAFVQTGLTSEKDSRLGAQLETLVRRYFLVPVRFLGALDWDREAAAAARNLEPVAKAYPMGPYSLSVEKVANLFLKEEGESPALEGHLQPVPLEEMDAYSLLDLPFDASAKEIQQAYQRHLEPYLENSPLTGSLYGKEEREAIRELFEKAYKTLITTSLRQRYDEELIAQGKMRPDQRVAEYRDPSPPGESAHPAPVAGAEPVEDTATRAARVLEAILQEIRTFDGPSLRAVREAQGVSVAEIVAETNIRSWYIESIEAERFDALPGLIYVKGFVRQVAQYLRLDPERVLRDYLPRYEAWLRRREGAP
ncbi:MAG: helix-turn-helix domain-containing protein [Acidobacteriota bacterium]